MNPFYKLNQTLANIGKEHDQIAESVEKAKAEVKSPARKTLEESLRSDMKALMEGQQLDELSPATLKSYRNKASGDLEGHEDNVAFTPMGSTGAMRAQADRSMEKIPLRKKGLTTANYKLMKKGMDEDGTGGANFSGSGSLEEKAGYSAKKAAAGKDIGKPGKNFAKIEKSAAKKYGSKEAGARVAGAVLNKLRAAKESVEEASMEMEAGAGGIHGNMPDPMTQKDQQKKMNPPQSLEELSPDTLKNYVKKSADDMAMSTFSQGITSTQGKGYKQDDLNREWKRTHGIKKALGRLEEEDQDIMEFLRSKLGHAEPHPYNKGTGKPDAHNGMEFEGNAFTGKLAHTPKGGEFELDGEEYKDTSSLEETVSRKHFQQVADLLRNIPDEAKRKEMAMHHASIFKQQNPRFDMRRFAAAAGVDLEECAMWEELKGGQHKLDVDHDGDIGSDDLADLRAGKEVTDEGFADMDAWLAQREKEKGTGRFDSRKVSTGTVYTRKPETFDMDDPETDPEATGGAPKRGRGRPAVAKKPERVTGKAWKHKGGRMQEEGEEMVDEKAEQGKRHFFDKLAPAAKKVAKVVAKVTGKEDDKAEKAGKKVAKDIEHDEGNKAKDDNKAEKAGKKVTKDIEYDDKKDRKEKKADKKKEEKVDETTTSGSVAPAAGGKSSGMGIGQGIYDSIERDFERLLNEAVNVAQEATMDEHAADGDEESITITATGDDVHKLKQALMAMGISHDTPATEPHADEPCHSCGGVPCQCDDMSANAGLPGEMEIEVVEANAPVTQNDPDYPTNQECSDDALQYSGGLNKPKATGQTTIPVIASQEERQFAESKSFLDLYKAFAKIK